MDVLLRLLDNAQHYFVASYAVHVLRYVLLAGGTYLLFYVLLRRQMLRRKMQAAFPRFPQMRREVRNSLVSFIIFAATGILTRALYKAGWSQLYFDVARYGWMYFWFSVVALIAIHDTWFYWTHRWMHSRRVFLLMHHVHHQSHNPTPWSAFSFHPLEAFVQAVIFPLATLLLPLHPTAGAMWLLYMTFMNVFGHLGFETLWPGFVRHRVWSWFNTSLHHNMHHRFVRCNYGLYFNVWDRLMGTNHPDYEEEYDRVTAPEPVPVPAVNPSGWSLTGLACDHPRLAPAIVGTIGAPAASAIEDESGDRRRFALGPVSRTLLGLILFMAGLVGALAYFNSEPSATASEPGAVTRTVSKQGAARQGDPDAPAVRDAVAAAVTRGATATTDIRSGRDAMQFSVALLRQGCERLERIPDYTATFHRQERIGGDLLPAETIALKLRHRPFSVYLKWLTGDKGRQVLYVDGENDGNMLVQLGGVQGRLLGLLSVDPQCEEAAEKTRHPITEAGLLALAKTALACREQDLTRASGVHCELRDNQVYLGRPCYVCTTTYAAPQVHRTHRKAVLYIDKELSMPVSVRNYTWAVDANPDTLDEDTLIEDYSYMDIQLDRQLADEHFDRSNSEYRFRR
jgi:sterol desaturase/sphingolipid hydroxylase (fatty acid hydroxylase superfamily)